MLIAQRLDQMRHFHILLDEMGLDQMGLDQVGLEYTKRELVNREYPFNTTNIFHANYFLT